MEAIIIARLIFALQTTEEIKTKITACTLWNVKHYEKVDLKKKYNRCKKKWLKRKN